MIPKILVSTHVTSKRQHARTMEVAVNEMVNNDIQLRQNIKRAMSRAAAEVIREHLLTPAEDIDIFLEDV